MRIAVYAICKNEEPFVDRWMDSMGEADDIVVLDTGSTDGTVERLRRRGAQVTVETVTPWRFDTARNRSLALVPEEVDVCVCTDLDEVFHPGWRAKLEAAWRPEVSRATYRYTWNFRPDGGEGVVFWTEKIHSRRGWRWCHPVHEVLEWVGEGIPGPWVRVEGLQLDHRADPQKSRGQYLPLLELSVQESPEDDRNMHYLGREYLFHRQWDRCIETLKRHLAMPSATWRDERCASMRYIAKALVEKGEREEAKHWLYRAAAEAPHLREPYVQLAALLCEEEDWPGTLYFAQCALRIEERPCTYICEADAWGSLPYDLAALGQFYLGRVREALPLAEEALRQSPEEPRLQRNVELIRARLEQEAH